MRRRVSLFALRLTQGLEIVAAFLVGVAVTVNLAQVFWRRILGSPLEWTEESMRYTMIWVAFLAAAAGLYRGDHMAAGVLGRVRNERVMGVIRYVILVVVAAFSAVLAFWGTRYALDTGQVSPALGISMNYPYAAIGVGGILMLVQAVCLMISPPLDGASPAVEKQSGLQI